ncbi:MAG: phosphate ABC transporter substrate-binding protein PstS [Propionicimonas sp.]|uniref:phosphate ABC transporter substrate-binding protein PstS n=1 Tax=Propionicimonas sp. TaxID=1955623 RepID=UPI002B1EA619|nr:phosphate ABC transporter substrate-binding protein PstS [Propionicimonas sp.]MEA4944942.1 phosphate ABC transporter substrate-binding protein PstS [Propionicimonas sp.]MEA5055622.1 phosphate ABC transporter substrate-binding protein PstS [Propionicimonas sp.]MEA5119267.1 phosphate ABC transporter substrate-binding protein PstS [Propionicimonas sp.]
MKITRIAAAVVAVTTALSLAACAANEAPASSAAPGGENSAPTTSTSGTALSGTLQGIGASSTKAAQEKWIADFQTANTGVTINYKPDGSGAGREAFIGGGADFAGSDRAFKDEELGAGKFAGCAADSSALNLPIYISPIAIVFNVEGVTDLTLDAATTAGIFTGQITTWNDPKIAATNSGVTLPDATITAVHRADGSGTTNNFTDTLSKLAGEVWTYGAADDWPEALSGGEKATGTSGVIDAVKNGKNTIGYADASAAGELGKASLLVAGTPQQPTAEAAAAIVDHSPRVEGRPEHDLALNLDRAAEGVYPAVLVSYALVCETYQDSAKAELVKAYLGYVASAEGQAAAASAAGSAPLSADLQAQVKASLDSVK